MTPLELSSIAVSLLSLAIAIWTAIRTNRLSGHEIRLGRRLELHGLIQDLDRELLHDPSLSGMFRSWQMSADPATPLSPQKQETYVTMYLNAFEAAYSVFRETRKLNRAELEIAEAWERYMQWFFEDCVPAVETWQKYRVTYYASFRDYIDRLVTALPAGHADSSLLDVRTTAVALERRGDASN